MLQAVVRLIIRFLTGLPDNLISNVLLTRMLGYVKDEVLKTRYGYSIHFRVTSPGPTSIRKQAVLGVYEKPYLSVLTKLIEPGDYVIDVGAHEGYVSLMMANKVGNSGRVFSIEPNPENLKYLYDNTRINSSKNVSIIPEAISDTKSQAVFYYTDDGGPYGSLINFSHYKTSKSVSVQTDTLDNLFYKPEYANRIKLCKLDIEGNEMKAIMGGTKLITEYKPHVAFEVSLTFWAYQNVSIETLFDFLKGRGYELFLPENGKLKSFEWLNERIMNMIAIHQSRKPSLLGKGIFASPHSTKKSNVLSV